MDQSSLNGAISRSLVKKNTIAILDITIQPAGSTKMEQLSLRFTMLAVVKEPHIELSLGGEPGQVSELLSFLRSRYTIDILTSDRLSFEEDESELDVRETSFWRENATPGRLLAGYRLKHELTQEQLAQRCGLHHVVISAYETGKRKISRKAAIKLANALGENVDTFWARLQV